MFGWFKKRSVTFDDQVQKLAELGITLNPGIMAAQLLEENNPDEFRDEPYDALLIAMGGEIYKEGSFLTCSDDIWHLDTECIEDHGDYAAIIDRLKRMTKLDIRKIHDYVDLEKEKAWVSFEYEGQRIKWNLEVNDDWIDPEVLEKFNELAGKGTEKALVLAGLGQDCLIAYLDEQQRRAINKLVKHKFE